MHVPFTTIFLDPTKINALKSHILTNRRKPKTKIGSVITIIILVLVFNFHFFLKGKICNLHNNWYRQLIYRYGISSTVLSNQSHEQFVIFI
jgi:hypothetical protein